MKAKEINASLAQEDFLWLQQTFHADGKITIPNEMIEKHNTDLNGFLTLVLMEAISNSNLQLVKYLLEQPYTDNILCNVDPSGYNPLFLSLMATNVPEIGYTVAEYIKNKKNFDKVILDQKQEATLLSIVKLPLFEYMNEEDYFEYLKDNYLQHLYTEKSLDDFEKLLGEELLINNDL